MGPSGVGKSTILAHATSLRRSDTPQWLSREEADRHFVSVPSRVRRRAVDDTEIRDLANWILQMVANSSMLPSQKAFATALFARSEFHRQSIRGADYGVPVVHDELLLNRAFSLLLYSDQLTPSAITYLHAVPPPDAAVVVEAPPATLLHRTRARNQTVNVYYGLDEPGKSWVARRASHLANLGAELMAERGVPTLRIDGREPPTQSAQRLHAWILDISDSAVVSPQAALRDRLMNIPETDTQSSGQRVRRKPRLPYASFHTRRFSVLRHQAQRDTVKRLEHFGLTDSVAAGKTVLDLGSCTGGLLLQLSNLPIRRGVGIDCDREGVAVARQIARLSGLDQIEFVVADIDRLNSKRLGKFDLVFCLTPGDYVQNHDRLYRLLANVTKERLYFEANSDCDIARTSKQLELAGFQKIIHLGISRDHIDPANNNRPTLIATK